MITIQQFQELMRNANLSQVARDTGLSYTTVHSILKGKDPNPTFKNILKLYKWYEENTAEINGGSGPHGLEPIDEIDFDLSDNIDLINIEAANDQIVLNYAQEYCAIIKPQLDRARQAVGMFKVLNKDAVPSTISYALLNLADRVMIDLNAEVNDDE